MSNVLVKGTFAAIILYSMVGIFGYLTFLNTPTVITTNILECYSNNVAITIVSPIRFIDVIIG